MTKKIKFRNCRPEDVDEAVPLIYAPGPDAFSYVFKNSQDTAIDFLKFAFQRRGGEFSFDNHYALMLDGELVGVGAVFSGKRASGFTLQDFLKIVKFYKSNFLPVVIRGLKVEQIIKLPKKNEVCIAHLGIEEAYRGHSLGTKLVAFLMEKANLKPTDYFVLDVSEENPRAQALYDRLGFKVKKYEYSKLKNEYGYVANHLRMEHHS